tara:strand:- start:79 stop:336 length:258 start_codon:yes stop_codon:yes gene_type:complete
MSLEKLKELEQEAMDNIDIDTYDDITGDVLDDYRRPIYLCGYIDGLQTAIRMLHEEQTADIQEYSVEMDDIFGDLYENEDEEITN